MKLEKQNNKFISRTESKRNSNRVFTPDDSVRLFRFIELLIKLDKQIKKNGKNNQ